MTSKFCILILVFGATGIAMADEPVRQPYHGPTPEFVKKVYEDLEKAKREPPVQAKSLGRAGIYPGDDLSPAFPKENSYENGWIGIVNGANVIVYAGYKRFDPTNGGVELDPLTAHGFVVIDRNPGKPDYKSNQINTPTAVGSLRIIAATGNVLTLQSRQGNKFSLNVETEQLIPIGKQ